MAGFIDDKAEVADLVVLGQDKEAAFLGPLVAPTAPRGDDLGETGMVVRIDCRDHDPVVGVVPGERLSVAGAGLARLQYPSVDSLPGIRPAVAQGFIGLTPLEICEEAGQSRGNGGPGGILFVVSAHVPQQGVDLRVPLCRQVEPAMTGGRVEHHAVAIADSALRPAPGRAGVGAEFLPTDCGFLGLMYRLFLDEGSKPSLARDVSTMAVEVNALPFGKGF